MKWGLLLGWGIAIYAVVFLVWSMLVIHGIIEGLLPHIVLDITLVLTLVFATKSLRAHRWYDVLPYSIGWLLITFLFDMSCAVPVSGWGIWSDGNIWVGYLLLFFVPLVVPTSRKRHLRAHVS